MGRYRRSVLLLLVAVLAGGALGLRQPPTGAHTPHPAMERIWLLGLGAVLHALALLLDGDLATVALAASLTAFIAAAVANRHLTGVAVVGFGLLLNLAAVVLNNGMPVRQSALEHAEAATTVDGPRHLETGSDAFGVLGDALPVPVTREVVSFGDLIVILGAAEAVRELTRRRARRWSEADRTAYRARIAHASVVQDWGAAPSARPSSGSQYSANPEDTAPLIIDLDSERATSGRRELVAASHRR